MEKRTKSFQTASLLNYKLLKDNAKKMRKFPTQAESIIWDYLKRNQLNIKFRRQHIIGEYIVDFVDLKSKTVIEIDGGYHNINEQIIADKERTSYLEGEGYSILRFSNEEIIHNISNVIFRIKDYITRKI